MYTIWLAGAPDNAYTRAAPPNSFLLTINLSDQFALSLSRLIDARLFAWVISINSFFPAGSLNDAWGFSGEHRWSQTRRGPCQQPYHSHQFAYWSASGPIHSCKLTACFEPTRERSGAATHSTAECCERPGQEHDSCPLACAIQRKIHGWCITRMMTWHEDTYTAWCAYQIGLNLVDLVVTLVMLWNQLLRHYLLGNLVGWIRDKIRCVIVVSMDETVESRGQRGTSRVVPIHCIVEQLSLCD